MDRRAFMFSTAATAATLFAMPAEARRHGRVTVDYGPSKLDIYPQANGRRAPVIVYLHGGGWRRGNRRYVQEKPTYFNSLGLVFVSVEYRMLPEADVATQRDDVTAAVQWVRANIAQFGGDPARIILMGHSAGAHLAALAALTTSRRMVRAFIANDVGVYDIAEYSRLKKGRMLPVFADAFPDQSQWAELSPATHAGPGTPPPALILYSSVRHHDVTSISFAQTLRAAGGNAQLFDGTVFSHAEINKLIGTPKGRSINRALETFLSSVGATAA